MASASARATHSRRTADQNGQASSGVSTWGTSSRLPQVQIGTRSLFWSTARSDSWLTQPVRIRFPTSPTLSTQGWFPSTMSSMVEPLRPKPVIFRTLTAGGSVRTILLTLPPYRRDTIFWLAWQRAYATSLARRVRYNDRRSFTLRNVSVSTTESAKTLRRRLQDPTWVAYLSQASCLHTTR